MQTSNIVRNKVTGFMKLKAEAESDNNYESIDYS